MTNEPERDVEKRLRAYAEKRRRDAGVPLELHPATRRMLQGEVSRLNERQPVGASWLERFVAAHWLEVAVSAAAVVALALAVGLLRPKSNTAESAQEFALPQLYGTVHPGDLAKAEPASGSATADSLKPSSGLTEEAELRAVPPTNERVFPPATDFFLAKTKAEVPEAGSAKPTVTLGTLAAGDRLNAEEAAPAIAGQLASRAARGRLAFSEVKENPTAGAAAERQVATLAQNFANRAPQLPQRNLGTLPVAFAVLNNFRVEQDGDRIQVIDQDGSTYAGYARVSGMSRFPTGSANAPASTFNGKRKNGSDANGAGTGAFEPEHRLADMAAEGTQQSQNYFFRVTGTNLALNEQVVFTGQLLAVTNGMVVEAAQVDAGERARLLKAAAKPDQSRATPTQIQSYRITGAAVIGKEQTISVDAVSVPVP